MIVKPLFCSLYKHFPLLATQQSLLSSGLNQTMNETSQERSRTPGEQAFAQLAAIGVTLAIAAIGGAFTGQLSFII